MATTIERTWLRRAVIAECSLIPFLVAYSRLYRGMHHLSDVIVGAINGLICAALAAHCLLHRGSETTGDISADQNRGRDIASR
jgi:undecaprenyl-diphosphatase